MSALSTRVVALFAGAAIALAPLSASYADTTPAPGQTATGGGSSGGASARPRTTFVLGVKHAVDSFNPFVGIKVESFEAYQLMYDTLTGSSAADFSPVPQLAKSWDTSADGKTWTFHLREGVTWSDGTPLTAKDVVYTFQRVIDGETENGQYGNYVTKVTKVSASDDQTVVFTTSEPTPAMLRMAVPILPSHVWSKVDSKSVATFANTDSPVGSGPFRLVEAKTGQFYRFAANKNYWAGAPKIDELIMRVFADDETMAQALRRGEIDMVQDVSAVIFEVLAAEPGITVSDSKYSGFNELAFNLGAATVDNKPIGDGHPALKDLQVRLAIDHAIDRTVLVDKVLRKHGSVATGVIPPVYADTHWEAGDALRGFDPAKANQILDAAGYPKGGDGVRVGKDGKKLKLRLFAREESEQSKKNVEYIHDWLADIGIDTVVQVMSEDQLTDVVGKGEYDMFEWGWVVEPDPDFQLSVFTCEQRSTQDGGEISAGWSDSFYCDPAYDELYAKQKTLINPAERNAVIKQAQQHLYANAVYSMLFYYNNFEAYRSDRFTGFVHQPSDGGTLAFQYGTHSYRNIEPVDPKALADTTKAANDRTRLVLIVGGVLLVLVAVLVAVLRMRRRAGADERE